jgi:hypothetical protein
MASPADDRLLELLEKWLASLDLHARYAGLDDDAYAKVQAWIAHERPSRWVIDLAREKTVALKARVEERIKQGDAQFSESLETMIFLANLVGAEHIQRFIPLAEAHKERALTSPPEAAASDDAAITGTREMPQISIDGRSGTPPSDSNQLVARLERKAAAAPAKAAGHAPGAQASGTPAAGAPGSDAAAPAAMQEPEAASAAAHDAREQVIADAVRLVQWGRKWFELPELIARMAGRPPLAEIRRILKENRLAIDAKSAKS